MFLVSVSSRVPVVVVALAAFSLVVMCSLTTESLVDWHKYQGCFQFRSCCEFMVLGFVYFQIHHEFVSFVFLISFYVVFLVIKKYFII